MFVVGISSTKPKTRASVTRRTWAHQTKSAFSDTVYVASRSWFRNGWQLCLVHLRSSCSGLLGLGRERAGSPSPVQQFELRTVFATEPLGKVEKSTVEQRAIVVRHVNEAGLLDEAAELDQMSRAFASCHHPGPRIRSRLCCLKPVPRLPIPLCRPCQRQQRRATIAGLFPERIARRARSTSS